MLTTDDKDRLTAQAVLSENGGNENESNVGARNVDAGNVAFMIRDKLLFY